MKTELAPGPGAQAFYGSWGCVVTLLPPPQYHSSALGVAPLIPTFGSPPVLLGVVVIKNYCIQSNIKLSHTVL